MTDTQLPSSSALLAWVSAAIFFLAVVHTFAANWIHGLARRFPQNSVRAEIVRLLGEVEIAFPLWAALFMGIFALWVGAEPATRYLDSLDFRGPAFVFVIMVTAGTRPIHLFASKCIERSAGWISKLRLLPPSSAEFFTVLSLGPLLGSLITEPAAMTISAWFLKERFLDRGVSDRFKYLALAVLLVNVSIGGVLTPYAAPPVIMVASKWNWGFSEIFQLMGWKSCLAVVVNAYAATRLLKAELESLKPISASGSGPRIPSWLVATHLFALAWMVICSQNLVLFIGVFLLFLGLVNVSRGYHERLKLKESLLVSAFLGGLVILGGMQEGWVSALLSKMRPSTLYWGAASLTSILDNAALAYLGAQVPGLSHSARYALLAGAVAGGGLTVMANAPNPAGFAILRSCFGENGIRPARVFLYALFPTLIALVFLGVFPA